MKPFFSCPCPLLAQSGQSASLGTASGPGRKADEVAAREHRANTGAPSAPARLEIAYRGGSNGSPGFLSTRLW